MTQSAFEIATGDRTQVPEDWMPATATRALILEDPVLIWLEFHGEANGFQKDTSPYEFTEFLFEKGKQFERKWLLVYAPEAVRVCDRAEDGLRVEKVRQTLDLMAQGVPAIAAPALWWSPERIYGIPDLIVRGAWLRDRLPAFDSSAIPDEQYVVLDIKFSAKLGDRQ